MINGIIEASLAMGGMFAALLVSYWTLKFLEPKGALTRITVKRPRYKKMA